MPLFALSSVSLFHSLENLLLLFFLLLDLIHIISLQAPLLNVFVNTKDSEDDRYRNVDHSQDNHQNSNVSLHARILDEITSVKTKAVDRYHYQKFVDDLHYELFFRNKRLVLEDESHVKQVHVQQAQDLKHGVVDQ